MTKKLKQGEKYPKGFTQIQILLKLCGKDITPTSEIIDFLKEQFYIREQKNIREHHLKILEKQRLIRRESAGRGHPDYWSVIPDFGVLKELVDRLKHDPNSQHKFMLSQYYRSSIPELVYALNCSFAEIGLTTIDIEHVGADPKFVDHHKKNTTDGLLMHHHREHLKHLEHLIESGELDDDVVADFKKQLASSPDYNPDPPYTFSDSELKDVTKALEYNWTMLHFIVHYLSADNESKRELVLKLTADARLATTSGAYVTATGWMSLNIRKFINNGVVLSGVVTDECQHFLDIGIDHTITDSMIRYAATKTIKQLLGRDTNELQTMWFAEWFAELDVIRGRYPFLFD